MTYHLEQKNQDSWDNDDKKNSDDDLNEKTEEWTNASLWTHTTS